MTNQLRPPSRNSGTSEDVPEDRSRAWLEVRRYLIIPCVGPAALSAVRSSLQINHALTAGIPISNALLGPFFSG